MAGTMTKALKRFVNVSCETLTPGWMHRVNKTSMP